MKKVYRFILIIFIFIFFFIDIIISIIIIGLFLTFKIIKKIKKRKEKKRNKMNKRKKIRKRKVKNKYKFFFLLIIIFIIGFSLFSKNNIQNVKAGGDFSNYLNTIDIDVLTDTSYIMNEYASSSNSYRNYFDIKDSLMKTVFSYDNVGNIDSGFQSNQFLFDFSNNNSFTTDYRNLTDTATSYNNYKLLNGSLNKAYNSNTNEIKFNSSIVYNNYNRTFGNLTTINGISFNNGSLDYRDSDFSQINSENNYETYSTYRKSWNMTNEITGFSAFINSTNKSNFLFSVYNKTSNNYSLDYYSYNQDEFSYWKSNNLYELNSKLNWSNNYQEISYDLTSELTSTSSFIRNGSSYLVLSNSPMKVFKYDLKFNYIRSYNLHFPPVSNPIGIHINGSYIYIVCNFMNRVYKYYKNLTWTGDSFSCAGQDANPISVASDRYYFYVIGDDTDRLIRYNSDGTYSGVKYNLNPQDADMKGVYYNDNFFYLTGTTNDKIYKYASDMSYTGVSYDVSGQASNPRRVIDNSTHIILLDAITDSFYIYNKTYTTSFLIDLIVVNDYVYLLIKEPYQVYILVYDVYSYNFITEYNIPLTYYYNYNSLSYDSSTLYFSLTSYIDKKLLLTQDFITFIDFSAFLPFKAYDGFSFDGYSYLMTNTNFSRYTGYFSDITNFSYNRVYEYDECLIHNNSIYFMENKTNFKGINYGYMLSKYDLFNYKTKVIYNVSISNYTYPYLDDKNYNIYLSIGNNITANNSIYVFNYFSNKYDYKLSIYNSKFEIVNISLNSKYFLEPNILVLINSTTPIESFELYIDKLIISRDLLLNKLDLELEFFFIPYLDIYKFITTFNILIPGNNFSYNIYLYNYSSNQFQLFLTNNYTFLNVFFQKTFHNNSINTIHSFTKQLFKIEIYIDNLSICYPLFYNFSNYYKSYSNNNGVHNLYIYYYLKAGINVRASVIIYFSIYRNFVYFNMTTFFNEKPEKTKHINHAYNGSEIGYIKTAEITTSIRYGKSMYDASDKFAVDINVAINHNLSLLIHKIYEFEYDYLAVDLITLKKVQYNNNYMDKGYCHSRLSGCRNVYGLLNSYDDFIYLGYFSDDINLGSYLGIKGLAGMKIDEPDLPTGKFWPYTSYRLITHDLILFDVGNWTNLEFQQIIPEKYTAKYPYSTEVIDRHSLGDWRFKIGDLKVSLNFIRNAIVYVLNAILLFLQWFFFLITAGLSFIFMFLGTWIITFLYNVICYYVYIGIIFIIWFLYLALFWLWKGLLWLWANIIYPFLVWIYTDLLPIILEALIIVMAFLIACFLWCLYLGEIPLMDLYQDVYEMIWLFVDFMIEWFIIFRDNFDSIILLLGWYLLTLGFLYLHYIYSRYRGYKTKAERLLYTAEGLAMPITFVWSILSKLLEGTPEA